MSICTNVDSYLERLFLRSDLDALVAIEKQAGEASWSRRTLATFEQRIQHDLRVIVSKANESIPIGFYAFEYRDQDLYIANIAVAKQWRRKGVASFALDCLAVKARRLDYDQIVLDVQEENLAAQLLYKSAGYRAVQICRKHYGNQDGYRMIKVL